MLILFSVANRFDSDARSIIDAFFNRGLRWPNSNQFANCKLQNGRHWPPSEFYIYPKRFRSPQTIQESIQAKLWPIQPSMTQSPLPVTVHFEGCRSAQESCPTGIDEVSRCQAWADLSEKTFQDLGQAERAQSIE